MKKVLCFGSINIDHVYGVCDFVQPGETVSCKSHTLCPGGKGFNQAVALARAGCPVWFSGKHGADADFMIEMLRAERIDTSLLHRTQTGSGHTVIQVTESGQNCIIVCPGANGEITREDVDETLRHFSPGDYLLLQNEIGSLPYIIRRGVELGMKVYVNPSPISEELLDPAVLQGVSGLILNEIEGEALTGRRKPEEILDVLSARYPGTEVLLTLGEKGAMHRAADVTRTCAAVKTTVVDTTAAGDTFTGYYISGLVSGEPIDQTLETASKAAAIAVSRMGAAVSVPRREEVC